MSFLRQLFGIRTRRNTTEQKLVRPNLVNAMDYECGKGEEGEEDDFFDYIMGYHDVKSFLECQ